MRRSRPAGLTMVELTIVTALLGTLMLFLGSVMVGVQRHTADGAARQDAAAQARRVANALLLELRDVVLDPADLEPDAPFECRDLLFRVAVDHAAGETIVDPPAASGQFRRLRLVDRRLERVAPNGDVIVLAEDLDDVAITLLPPDRLRLRVVVQRRGADGQRVFGIDELVVHLRNRR